MTKGWKYVKKYRQHQECYIGVRCCTLSCTLPNLFGRNTTCSCGLNSGNSKNFKQSILTKICKIPKEGFCFFDMEFICHETIF